MRETAMALCFVLGFLIIGTVTFAFADKKEKTITEIWYEPVNNIPVAYIEDSILKSTENNEAILMGYMPTTIIKKKVKLKRERDKEMIEEMLSTLVFMK